MDVPQISPAEALELQAQGALLVDVREQTEWDAGHAPGSVHLPMSELAARWQELPDADATVFVCRSGQRSQQAALAFTRAGRAGCRNLAGGLKAWELEDRVLEPADGYVA